MKFIWEADDLWSGRRINLTRVPEALYMVFADNSIGGASRFGLVSLDDGCVIERGQTQTELADRLNTEGVRWAPISLNKDPDFDEVG